MIELKGLKKKWKRAKREERPGLITLRKEMEVLGVSGGDGKLPST